MTHRKNPLKPRDTVELNCNRNFDLTYRPFRGGASVLQARPSYVQDEVLLCSKVSSRPSLPGFQRAATQSAPVYIVPVDLRAYIR
jgi:hypothetical protein